jgi:hypothetical protein
MSTKSKSAPLVSGILGCILGGFTGALFLPAVTWLSFYFSHQNGQDSGPSASDVIGFAIYFIWIIGPIVGAVLGSVAGSILGWFLGRRFGIWGAILAGIVAGLLSYPSGHLLLWLWMSHS